MGKAVITEFDGSSGDPYGQFRGSITDGTDHPRMVTAREEVQRRGWSVEYRPHDEIARYNACYRVEYDGELIYPPAADNLGIPENEIWISEQWRRYERFILYHELREIEHRAAGHDVKGAHERAERDERALWANNPRWRVMNAEWDVGRAHLPFPHDE